MNEMLDNPSITLFCKTISASGTDTVFSTGVTNAVDIRTIVGLTAQVGPMLYRKATIIVSRTTLTTSKSLTYTIGHAASVTDAATNSTALLTITETANAATDLVSRFELDLNGLNPAIRFAVANGTANNTAGTAESCALCATLILSRPEQTPIASSVLATGTVKIYAAGATQSN